MSLDEIRLEAGVLAFRKVLINLLLRESGRGDSEKVDGSPEEVQDVNGSAEQPQADDKSDPRFVEDVQESKTVLTLLANASGPRQLFSSLQRPVRVNATRQANHLDTSVHVSLPLNGVNLPHIISTTQITPIHTGSKTKPTSKGAAPTLKDIFTPPAHLPLVQPPKSSKPSTNRSNTISWSPRARTPQRTRLSAQTYPTQNLSTGQWLGYGGVELPREPFSPEAKRKQRDRALSTGEVNPHPTQDALAAIDIAKRDALFRSAYSSFAPDHDDSVAIIPEKVKSRVWWHKVNERPSIENFALDPALEQAGSDTLQSLSAQSAATANENDAFKEAYEDFEPLSVDDVVQRSANAEENKEVQDLLDEISELLETLYSYQKIRHSTIASPGRPPIAQSASAQLNMGSGSEPSDAEFDLYKMLKSQLSMMISMLPPFAVAKLNGEQLADLGVSRRIIIETKDYKGVMEEDQLSKLARTATSLGATNRVMHGQPTAQHSPAASNYNRPSSAARQGHATQSYYPQQQPPARTPAINHQRRSGYAQSYHTPNSIAKSTYRPMHANYDNQNTKFSQQPNYSHINSVQQFQQQRPQQGYAYNPHHYPQAAMAQGRNYAPMTSPANQARQLNTYQPQGYNPQANSNALNAATPMKTPQVQHHHQQQQQQQQQQHPHPHQQQYANMRAGYSTPAPVVNRSQYVTPNGMPMGYSASHATKPATPSSLGPSGFHTSMTTEQQQLMMDRQRAQLGMQAQVASIAAQHVLPTPTPPAPQAQVPNAAQQQFSQLHQQTNPSQYQPQPQAQPPQHQNPLSQPLSQATPTVEPSRDVQMMNGHQESQINGRTTVA